MDMLVAFGVEAMLSKSDKANRANYAEGATLLQLIIQSFYKILTKKHIEVIMTKCFVRLQNADNMKLFLKAR